MATDRPTQIQTNHGVLSTEGTRVGQPIVLNESLEPVYGDLDAAAIPDLSDTYQPLIDAGELDADTASAGDIVDYLVSKGLATAPTP